MEFKTTRRLFRNTYQYKIVLVCAGSSLFRSGDVEATLDELKNICFNKDKPRYNNHIKSKDDLDYAIGLASELAKMADYDLRVEAPWISIYTKNESDVNKLVNLDSSHVKYVSKPDPSTSLASGTIVMPKMAFDYRITLGKTTQPNYSFIEWAESSKKCKLTKSCVRDLGKPRSWGGTHFYITGDNNLLLAKMHLGGSIAKVERIVKN
jgi:hypothetical protein